jgi:hypothetical protein
MNIIMKIPHCQVPILLNDLPASPGSADWCKRRCGFKCDGVQCDEVVLRPLPAGIMVKAWIAEWNSAPLAALQAPYFRLARTGEESWRGRDS